MKKWFKNFATDNIAACLGTVNVFIVLIAALLTKAFNSDVSIFTGVAFLVGFVALVVEWIAFRKSDTAPAGACIGFLAGVLFTYLLGV